MNYWVLEIMIFSREATLELAMLVRPSGRNANSKHQNQESKSSIKIKRQNQVSSRVLNMASRLSQKKAFSPPPPPQVSIKIKHHQES